MTDIGPTASPPTAKRTRLATDVFRSVALLCMGLVLGSGINLATAATSEAASLQALEQRVAALERALALTDDGLRLSTRGSSLTLNSRGLELRGRVITLVADDRLSAASGTQSSLTLDKYGEVELRGLQVDVRGSKGLTLKGSKISEN